MLTCRRVELVGPLTTGLVVLCTPNIHHPLALTLRYPEPRITSTTALRGKGRDQAWSEKMNECYSSSIGHNRVYYNVATPTRQAPGNNQ